MPAAHQDPLPRQTAAVYRILDANLNRCTEGLRVTEEHLRFVCEDAHLSSICKELRHDLASCMQAIPASALHAARDVSGDVGTHITTDSEERRGDIKSVVTANLKRVAQSLRSLEEYTKLLAPQLAAELEALRYRSYTLERSISLLYASQQRLDSAYLYVLIDGRESLDAFEQTATLLLHNDVDVLQLRDKRLSDRELLERAQTLRRLTRDAARLFVMNDRIDLALASGADGVHLGQDDLSVGMARRILGPDVLIGVSTHAIEQAREAVLDGANYIGCGPTFPSQTKSFEAFPGLDYLRQVAAEIALPAFAIGGIDCDNITDVCETGFSRVAASNTILSSPDPGKTATTLALHLRSAIS